MYYVNILKQELSSAKTYWYSLLEERSVIDRHQCHTAAKFNVYFDENYDKLSS